MPKPKAGIFIHISKFQKESILNYLQEIQNWHDNQKSLKKIYLCFPIFFWQEIIKDDLLHFWIKKMIQEKNIIYCPNTFSGENHQTLDYEEIEYDLSSTLSNSENIGYVDLFNDQPTFIYISNRDLYREKIQNIYHNYQKSIFIESLRRDEKNQLYLLLWKDLGRKYVNIHSTSLISKIKGFFRYLFPFFSEKKLFFWSSLTRTESLSNFLDLLTKKYFTDTNLENLLEPAKGYMTCRYAFMEEDNIEILSHSYIRQQKKSSSHDEKEIKENITNYFLLTSVPNDSLSTDPQQIWEGDVSLSSKDLKFNFNKGQLFSISNRKKSDSLIGKMKSYWISNKNLKEFLYSSFSITQQKASGLRQILSSFEKEKSYLDFFPIEDHNMFLINANLNWPHKILSSQEVVFLRPIEITLCKIPANHHLKVTIFNTDGSRYERYISNDFHEETLWGEAFVFDNYKTSVVIAFVSSEDLNLKHPIALKVSKKRGRFYLIIKIEQSYYCADKKNSNNHQISQCFSYVIYQPNQTPYTLAFLPSYIKNRASKTQIVTNKTF